MSMKSPALSEAGLRFWTDHRPPPAAPPAWPVLLPEFWFPGVSVPASPAGEVPLDAPTVVSVVGFDVDGRPAPAVPDCRMLSGGVLEP